VWVPNSVSQPRIAGSTAIASVERLNAFSPTRRWSQRWSSSARQSSPLRPERGRQAGLALVVTRIVLRVSPNAKRSEIVGPHGQGWKVRVAAPRDGGKANAELLRLLAAVLGIPPRQLRVVAGVTSPDKVVVVDGLSFDDVNAALARA
jgi:uncharacterized protein (TIGR00251 family)